MMIENLKYFFKVMNVPYQILHKKKIVDKNNLYDEIYRNNISSNIYKYNKKYYKLITKNINLNNVFYTVKYFLDITDLKGYIYELKKENERLKKDIITGLATRSEIENYIARLTTNAVVVMCDIDNFKVVNDTYGHSKGDLVLKELGNIIKRNISIDKDKNNFAGRYGGEEFLIIFDTNDVNFVKKRIDILNEQFNKLEIVSSLSFSAGISIFNKEKHIKKAIEEADFALYRAKKTGKNKCIIYTKDMEKQEQNI